MRYFITITTKNGDEFLTAVTGDKEKADQLFNHAENKVNRSTALIYARCVTIPTKTMTL